MKSLWLGVLACLGLASCVVLPSPGLVITPRDLQASLPPPPPWAKPFNPLPGINAAGLRAYLQDTYDTHIHAHLDVFYNGQPVTVPGGLGIGPDGLYIAPLHTHTPTGVLHLEAPFGMTFTVGQVFTEWGVPLTGATAYDHGSLAPDAAGLVIQDHHEIVVTFGTSPGAIPVEYNGWLCIDWKLCE